MQRQCEFLNRNANSDCHNSMLKYVVWCAREHINGWRNSYSILACLLPKTYLSLSSLALFLTWFACPIFFCFIFSVCVSKFRSGCTDSDRVVHLPLNTASFVVLVDVCYAM